MENKSPVENVLEQTLSKLKSIVDIDCIVGNAIKTDGGETIIPISRVTIGFVTGGGEYCNEGSKKIKKDAYPFSGGTGAGCNISPIGFLVCNDIGVKFVNVNFENNLAKIIEMANSALNKFKKGKK